MNEELEVYDEVRDRLMDEFIKNVSPWIKWDEISGFEERMALSCIRGLISDAYHAGQSAGIIVMASYVNKEVFGNDPASKV